MNEELKAQAITALKGIIESAVRVKDFAVEQAPSVIQELLQWKMAESLLVTGFMIFIITVLGLISYKTYQKHGFLNSLKDDISGAGALVLFSGVAGAMLGVSSFLISDFVWLQILIAPKVYLIEYAAQLIK